MLCLFSSFLGLFLPFGWNVISCIQGLFLCARIEAIPTASPAYPLTSSTYARPYFWYHQVYYTKPRSLCLSGWTIWVIPAFNSPLVMRHSFLWPLLLDLNKIWYHSQIRFCCPHQNREEKKKKWRWSWCALSIEPFDGSPIHFKEGATGAWGRCMCNVASTGDF